MSAFQIRDLPAFVHRLFVAAARRRRRRAVITELSRQQERFDFTRIPLPEDLIRADRNR